MSKIKMQFDVPKKVNTDIYRVRELCNTVFTRARILTLALVLIVALSISGTLAYLAWTSNQTPNRAAQGDVEIEIIEVNKKGSTTTNVNTGNGDSTGSADSGTDTKVVSVKSDDDGGRAEEVACVHFLPEIESKQVSGANVAITEYWGRGVQGNAASGYYLETDVLKLWLASDWQDSWFYDNGAFYYKKVLGANTETPTLLTGVTLNDNVDPASYSSIKVRVVADALQITDDAIANWGIQITGTGDDRVVSKKTETDS